MLKRTGWACDGTTSTAVSPLEKTQAAFILEEAASAGTDEWALTSTWMRPCNRGDRCTIKVFGNDV